MISCRSLALYTLLAASLPARAADVSQLGLSQSQVDALNAQLTAPMVAPGISFGSPVAFGAAWGQAFAGVGGTTVHNAPSSNHGVDGSVSAGFGIGNPYRYAGLEATVTSISVRDSFGDSGDVSVKLHRVLPGRSGIAVGVDNTSRWGAAKATEAGTYAAFTKVLDLNGEDARSPIAMSFNIGVGNGRFTDPGKSGVGVFGSVAIAPWRQVSFIADWGGRDANAAVSLVPFARMPVVLTLGAINLAHRFNQDTEFAGGIGYLFTF